MAFSTPTNGLGQWCPRRYYYSLTCNGVWCPRMSFFKMALRMDTLQNPYFMAWSRISKVGLSSMQLCWHFVNIRKPCWWQHKMYFTTYIDMLFLRNGTLKYLGKQQNTVKLFKRYDHCNLLLAIFLHTPFIHLLNYLIPLSNQSNSVSGNFIIHIFHTLFSREIFTSCSRSWIRLPFPVWFREMSLLTFWKAGILS